MFHGAFNYCLLCHCRHLSLQIDGIITTQAEIHSAVCPPLPSQPPQLPLSKLFICALQSSPWKCLCPFPACDGWPRLRTVLGDNTGGWGMCRTLQLRSQAFVKQIPPHTEGFVQLVWTRRGLTPRPGRLSPPACVHPMAPTQPSGHIPPTTGCMFLVRRHPRACRHRVYRAP